MSEYEVPEYEWPNGLALPVRRATADVLEDAESFYAVYGDQPLLVTGVDVGIDLTLEDVAAGAAGDELRVWDWSLDDYVMVPTPKLVEGLVAGDTWFNVVDHPIAESPLAERLRTPPAFERNWFTEMPPFAAYASQLMLTPPGAFTPAHLDSCYQGWARLLTGVKRWRLWSPEVRPLLYDVAFRRFRHPPPPKVDWHEVLQRPGEMVYFPSGWVHEVRTLEPAIGVGGSMLNEFTIVEAVRWWLIERTLSTQGRLNLTTEIGLRWETCGAHQDKLAEALALIDEWLTTRIGED